MEQQPYLDYLALLDELRTSLDRLSELARQKTDAVRRDDLMALDEALKQEQAMSLSLRGQEIKRLKLLSQLGLDGSNLSRLEALYPPALRFQAKQTVDALRQSYEVYRCTAGVARSTLECSLHELEKFVSAHGGGTVESPGYTSPGVEPPKTMKTDFRA